MRKEWGRKETVIWPPHSPIYTYGAIFLALVFTGLFLYCRFAFGNTPLQRFYTPVYLRATAMGAMSETRRDAYRLLFAGGRDVPTRLVSEADVISGSTPEADGKTIPLAFSQTALRQGYRSLFRGPKVSYMDASLSAYLRQYVYAGRGPLDIYREPILMGLMTLFLQLPFSIPRDIKRKKELKYGRRLRGPVMLTPRQFNRSVQGDGIGFKTSESRKMMRIPLRVEDQHIELMGDTGSGKTALIMQVLRQIQGRGQAAIVYDPACEFIRRFYNARRGDVVLNPLDERCPYWGPSEELRRKSEADAIAVSLFQPPQDKKGEFFYEIPQQIFAHLLHFRPTPEELIAWMSNPKEIDRRVQGTEVWNFIDRAAPPQRIGVLASLSKVAKSLRLLPKKGAGNGEWTAAGWSEKRNEWIFITSEATQREALRPLQSLWIDLLVLRLLNAPQSDQKPVWFVLDELASLQRLPQLHTAITENRKSKNPLLLGFQGKAQLEVIYGHLAEVMLSQPATKIFLKTTEPEAAQWVSKAIGNVEIERVRETHFDGTRVGKNFTVDRQIEPLVMDSEISGLEERNAFLKLGNNVARFHFDYMDLPKVAPDFLPRKLADDEFPRLRQDGHTDEISETPVPADAAGESTSSSLVESEQALVPYSE